MKKYIYADNAATTKLDKNAYKIMKQYLMYDYSNPSQLYSFSKKSKKELNNARKIIAKCINAEPEEIYFTSGGTESNNWVIKQRKEEYERKRQFRHDWIIATASAISGAILGFLASLIFWLIEK